MLVTLLPFTPALAQDLVAPPESRRAEVRPVATEPTAGLRFLGVVDARATTSNVNTTNPLVNGQIVGTLGGTNSTTTDRDAGAWTEERVGAFFAYAPPLLSGRATLEAAFEIDFAFGDSSYGTGGNTGGGFGADQVNLQTRRLAARFNVLKGLDVVTGLQFVGDGAQDPSTARPDDLLRSGGRLMFWGSEAAGITAYAKLADDAVRLRAGGYTLYELGFSDGDDATLFMADAEYAPAYAMRIGIHVWYLRDRSAGLGGLLGVGPTSSLSELQGGPRLDYRADDTQPFPDAFADLSWVVIDGGYNRGLDMGPFGITGLAAGNVGRVYLTGLRDRAVTGALVDGEVRWRFASGKGSILRAEALWASGDDARDDQYTGVITGNSYGIAGAVHATHGCYLLFPDVGAINRQSAIVYDVSGAGRGLFAFTGGVAYDALPNRVTVGVGGGHARNGQGDTLGTEVNGRIVATPLPLLTVGVHAGTVIGSSLLENPWTAFVALDWLVI